MTKPTPKTWPELAVESWMLGAEMSMVIWLRSIRMMAGGKLAEREAQIAQYEKDLTPGPDPKGNKTSIDFPALGSMTTSDEQEIGLGFLESKIGGVFQGSSQIIPFVHVAAQKVLTGGEGNPAFVADVKGAFDN